MTRAEHPVANQPACTGCHGSVAEHPLNGILVVDHATSDLRREALISAAGLVVLGGLATLAASVALALGLRRIVVRPVAALAGTVEAMAHGDLGARVQTSGHDEIAALGRGLNRMAENVEQSQAALIRAERMSQALIDAIPDGIRVIGPDFRIHRANAAYAAQTGRPLTDIVGQFCYASSHGRDTPCPYTLVTCPVVEMQKDPHRITFRDMHQASPERQMSVEVSAAPLDGNVVEAIRDLDEQARMSQAQRRSESGRLATGGAHDIHTPLSSIALALNIMARDLDTGRSDRLKQYFALTRSEISQCLEITDTLLRLGSPASSRKQLIELASSVTAVTRLLAYQADNLGITVKVDIAPDLRVLIADSDLRMVVTNLLMNAFHAMPHGGRLTIRGGRGDGSVILTVADTGIGIAPEHLQDIFMPFWSRRADDTTGRGLGLAITRTIADRAGATISVESTLRQGSCFTLSFPDPDNLT